MTGIFLEDDPVEVLYPDVMLYDIKSNTFERIGEISRPRACIGSIYFDNAVYLFGGCTHRQVDYADVYDLSSNQERELQALPQPDSWISVTNVKEMFNVGIA